MPVISIDCHEYESKLKKRKEAAEHLMIKNNATSSTYPETVIDTPPAPLPPIEVDEDLKSSERKSLKAASIVQPQTDRETTERKTLIDYCVNTN
jgi:hypothetical protein